jgi:hypothetical protein
MPVFGSGVGAEEPGPLGVHRFEMLLHGGHGVSRTLLA